jgi:hypothetical protein
MNVAFVALAFAEAMAKAGRIYQAEKHDSCTEEYSSAKCRNLK